MNELEKSFLEFARYVQEQVDIYLQDNEAPIIRYYRFHFTEEGGEHRINNKIFYGQLMRVNIDRKNIWESDAAKKLINDHRKAGLLDNPELRNSNNQIIDNPTFDQLQPHLVWPFLGIIEDTMKEYESTSPSQQQLLEKYRSHITRINMLPRLEAIVPLTHFASETSSINFGKISLSVFTPEEKNKAWPIIERDASINTFIESNYKLIGTHQLEAGKPMSMDMELASTMTALLTAFRLCKPGRFGASLYFERFAETEMISMATMLNNFFLARPDTWNFNKEIYELKNSDLSLIKRLFSLLEEQEHRGQHDLSVSLSRFNQSYSRDSIEDKLIDLSIALESCLLSGVKDELQFRLSIRGTALLSESREPQEIKNKLETIYKCRSNIVHEGANMNDIQKLWKPISRTAQEFIHDCETVVREILREFVLRLSEPSATVRKLNEELDLQIIDGLGNTKRKTSIAKQIRGLLYGKVK